MRINVSRSAMILLRGMGLEGRPLWEAIERLRKNQSPPDAIFIKNRPGRREMHVRIGTRGYWLQWEVTKDRSETVIAVMLIEEN